MTKLTVGAMSAIAAMVLAAIVLATSAAAAKIPRVPNLPPGWSHAEINVVINRQPHTLVYDHGQVQAVTASSLTLKELDGQVVTINVAPTAKITINGQPASLSQVRVREVAATLGIDGGAAVSVKVQIPPALAAAIARQQARQARRQARHQ